jgi:hypothetical protein
MVPMQYLVEDGPVLIRSLEVLVIDPCSNLR